MFERFTERARQVVVLAQEEARNLKHEHIGTEHLLLGVLRETEGIGARVLDAIGVNEAECRNIVREKLGEGQTKTAGQIPFTPRCHKVLELSLREALALGHNYIGTEHILLGLVRENEGLAASILAGFSVDGQKVRDETIGLLNRGPDNAKRWAEYVICRKRGHVARQDSHLPRDVRKEQCRHCGTFYWAETIVRESGAPAEPKAQAA